MNDRPHYPWKEGDALFADELNAAIANAGSSAESGGAENVIGHGADPTGVIDSSAAFNAALSVRRNGRPVDVFAPAGDYLLNSPIHVGDSIYAQRLSGAGWSTVLTVGPGFSSSALGVILIQPDPYNDFTAQASVCDLRIHFQQPPDFAAAATAVTAAGGTTVTVANTSGVHVGYYCADTTNPGALPWQSIAPKVTAIAGNVVTLDRAAIGTVAIGDIIAFAANRSQAVALSSSPNTSPGSPAIKYPWAIYVDVAQSVFFDHLLVTCGWNGIYIRGQTFAIGQYFESCLNIGLDVDQCYNFPKIDHFMHWGWSLPYAMTGIYYDGQTIAANLGQCDSLNCDVIQSWCGIVNLTAAWSWGAINQLALDGDNANLNIIGNGSGWVQIGSLYKTGGLNGIGVPLTMTTPCVVSIGSALMSGAQNNPLITMSGGSLTIASGYLWGVSGANSVISVTGGNLSLDQIRFDGPAGRTQTYLVQTGATGSTVRISNSAFIAAPGAGAQALNLADTRLNAIMNVEFNGWGFTAPGPLGRYDTVTLPGRPSYANDAAAAAGGVDIGQEYRNGSIRMVRVT